MSAYDTDLAERCQLLQQDVIALRHALERTQTEKMALREERDRLFEQINEDKHSHALAVGRLRETIRECFK